MEYQLGSTVNLPTAKFSPVSLRRLVRFISPKKVVSWLYPLVNRAIPIVKNNMSITRRKQIARNEPWVLFQFGFFLINMGSS